MNYKYNEVLHQQEDFLVKKIDKRRFAVIDGRGNILNAYSTLGAAKLSIQLTINAQNNHGKKRMGEK